MGLFCMDKPIILYDGYCNLCDQTTQLILKYDKQNKFRFIALQSSEGKKLITDLSEVPESVILLSNGLYYTKSDAILEISRQLGFPAKLFLTALILPKRLRNFIYDLVAKNRYKLFGKKTVCNFDPHKKKFSNLK